MGALSATAPAADSLARGHPPGLQRRGSSSGAARALQGKGEVCGAPRVRAGGTATLLLCQAPSGQDTQMGANVPVLTLPPRTANYEAALAQ